jgi:hypothetical protein
VRTADKQLFLATLLRVSRMRQAMQKVSSAFALRGWRRDRYPLRSRRIGFGDAPHPYQLSCEADYLYVAW